MIRVRKSQNVPESLATTKAYDGEDVHGQLRMDQHGKCYLCERALCTDFNVEHLRGREGDLLQDWNNLFWACSYCNGKKLGSYNDILDPARINIEDEIKQEIDFGNKKAIFHPVNASDQQEKTIALLNLIHNGRGIRKIREEQFFEHIVGVINSFLKVVNDFLDDSSPANRALVCEELQITKECLGFKYWIIKGNPFLKQTFKDDIIWNK